MTPQDIPAAAAKGAALLDQKMPGWYQLFNLHILSMSKCSKCILGQLFSYYQPGLACIGITDREGEALGFSIPLDMDSYDKNTYTHYPTLTRAWKHEVVTRLAADEQEKPS